MAGENTSSLMLGAMEPYRGQDPYGNTQFNPGLDMGDISGNYGSNFLGAAGNFFGGKDGMSNAGSLLGGIAGMYGMYQSHQAGKDNAKNNSLYRELMRDEANYKNKFRSGWGNTSWGGK